MEAKLKRLNVFMESIREGVREEDIEGEVESIK